MLQPLAWATNHMSAVDPGKPDDKLATRLARSDLVRRASIAQMLLVARLRAKNRRDLGVDLLERATQVILVTCKNWFSPGPTTTTRVNEEKNEKNVMNVSDITNESEDAHRNH